MRSRTGVRRRAAREKQLRRMERLVAGDEARKYLEMAEGQIKMGNKRCAEMILASVGEKLAKAKGEKLPHRFTREYADIPGVRR